jgi:hypothetical protein
MIVNSATPPAMRKHGTYGTYGTYGTNEEVPNSANNANSVNNANKKSVREMALMRRMHHEADPWTLGRKSGLPWKTAMGKMFSRRNNPSGRGGRVLPIWSASDNNDYVNYIFL